MADFVAVIRKAVDNLPDNTPENRAKVYDKARAAIRRQLEAINPPPSDEVIARQLDKLGAAIDEVESEHAEALPADVDETEALMAELESMVEKSPVIAEPKPEPKPKAESRPEPKPEPRIEPEADDRPAAPVPAPAPAAPVRQDPSAYSEPAPLDYDDYDDEPAQSEPVGEPYVEPEPVSRPSDLVGEAHDAAFGLDHHVDPAPREKRGRDQVGDHAGIVQRRAGRAVFLLVETLEEVGPFGHRAADRRAEGAERLDPLARGQRLVGQVERHHGQGHAGTEHDVGRLGIDIDVELGRGGDVADLEIGAAHQHDLGDTRHDVGGAGEGGGDVGQGADRAERDAARRLGAQGLDEEIDGMGRLQLHRGLGQARPVEPGLAMDVLGGDELARQRRVAAGEDLHLAPPGQLADDAGILRGQRQRHVAGHRGQAEKLDLAGAGQRQQDRHGVVLAGIGVDDDLARRHGWRRPPGGAARLARRRAAVQLPRAAFSKDILWPYMIRKIHRIGGVSPSKAWNN